MAEGSQRQHGHPIIRAVQQGTNHQSPSITLSTHHASTTLPPLYDVFNAVRSERRNKQRVEHGHRRGHHRRSLPTLPSQRSHQRLANLRHRLDRLRSRRSRQLLTRLPRGRSPQAHHAPAAPPSHRPPLISPAPILDANAVILSAARRADEGSQRQHEHPPFESLPHLPIKTCRLRRSTQYHLIS